MGRVPVVIVPMEVTAAHAPVRVYASHVSTLGGRMIYTYVLDMFRDIEMRKFVRLALRSVQFSRVMRSFAVTR